MNMTTRRTVRACVFAAALAASLATGGCRDSGGGGAGSRRDSGASVAAGKSVPKGAARVKESAQGGRLFYRIQRPGTIWVQDASTREVIFTGQVRAASNIVVDSAADAVTINNQQVRHAPRLNPDHRYRLYFR